VNAVSDMRRKSLLTMLQAAPLVAVLLVFFGVPMMTVIVVSFCDYEHARILPTFTFDNYADLLRSDATLRLYLGSIKFTLFAWALTLAIGFTVAYFLVFHVEGVILQMSLFLVCTIPFWTSNIIRMISWIPFLGREGLFNHALADLGVIHRPLDFLLFSDFSVILAYVHLYTLFMVVPIFNAMARIDKRLLEAARDAGASRWQTVRQVVIPLSRTGIALGSIFVVALTMGDFFVVKVMSGGQSSSIVAAMYNEIAGLQFPPAAASAVVLTAVVMAFVAAILRVVDVRRELIG